MRLHELSRTLQHITPRMSLVEGQPHLGAIDNADFLATFRNQSREHALRDGVILTTHPVQHNRAYGTVLTTWQQSYYRCARLRLNGLFLTHVDPTVFPLWDMRNAI